MRGFITMGRGLLSDLLDKKTDLNFLISSSKHGLPRTLFIPNV